MESVIKKYNLGKKTSLKFHILSSEILSFDNEITGHEYKKRYIYENRYTKDVENEINTHIVIEDAKSKFPAFLISIEENGITTTLGVLSLWDLWMLCTNLEATHKKTIYKIIWKLKYSILNFKHKKNENSVYIR